VGVHARLMSQALRKLAGVISKTNCIVIFINQLREKIGVMYGNPETTTGGRALKFYTSVRIDVRKSEQIKNGQLVLGNRTKAKVVKNKLAPPFRVAEFDILFGEGISREGCLLDIAVSRDIIHKSGAWFSYKEQRIGQGRENARLFIKQNPDMFKEVERMLRQELAARGLDAPIEPGEAGEDYDGEDDEEDI
jgi:recombination protein RecA